MRIGANLSSGTYKGAGLEEEFRMIAEAGFEGIMLYIDEKFLSCELESVNRLIKNSGLSVLQVHPPWPNLASRLNAVREEAMETYKRWLEYAFKLDAESVVIHASADEQPSDRKAATGFIVENIRVLARDFPSIMLALENTFPKKDISAPIGSTKEELLWICREINMPNVGICLDTSHCLSSAIDPLDFIAVAGDLIVTTHLSDNTLVREPDSGLIKDRHLMPGNGIIDWRKLFNSLKTHCPDASWVLEIPTREGGGHRDDVIEMGAFLKKHRDDMIKKQNGGKKEVKEKA